MLLDHRSSPADAELCFSFEGNGTREREILGMRKSEVQTCPHTKYSHKTHTEPLTHTKLLTHKHTLTFSQQIFKH